MNPSISISESELLQAVRDSWGVVSERPEGALTVSEMADSLGLSMRAVQRRIGELARAGRLEWTIVAATDALGRACRKPVYRLIAAPKKKAKR